jgi:hypothetical protein
MLAQVSLIPAESKKLIAKAVTNLDIFQRALRKGSIILHPSSSTYFMIEEITGRKPPTDVWICGLIVPKGACVEMGTIINKPTSSPSTEQIGGIGAAHNPAAYPYSWALRRGELLLGEPLGSLLEQMGSEDIYVKGVNALDVQGTVGVLWGSLAEGGTMALVMKAQQRKQFKVIFPAGLEKLVPFPLNEVAREAKKSKYDYGMGIPCGLLPCQGVVVTELKAIEMLSGAKAIPIAAGGLGGAEGAITLVIKGSKAQVTKAIENIEDSKGAILPPIRIPSCYSCPNAGSMCRFPVKDKPWT